MSRLESPQSFFIERSGVKNGVYNLFAIHLPSTEKTAAGFSSLVCTRLSFSQEYG